MSNLNHLFKINQNVKVKLDNTFYDGIVKEVYEDHIIVNAPEISDHLWFERDLNLDCVYPDYNF